MAVYEELKVFTGTAHPALAKAICEYLNIPLGQAEVFKFSNDNTFVRILENIRMRDVFIVQPLAAPVNDNIMELLIMMDAAKRSSAGRITAVVPYYGYGRTDKKDQPRVPITARLLADLLTAAGAERILTIDLHAGQIQGFFNIPVDELTALTLLSGYFKERVKQDEWVLVAVDIGISKRARDFAEGLNIPLAIIEKRRIGNLERTEMLNVIGDVKGRKAILFDDEIDTAGSVVQASRAVLEFGATEVYAACTHPVFSGPAGRRLDESKIREIVTADTIPPRDTNPARLHRISVAPLLGEAIYRIHHGLSVGALFT